MTSKLTQKEMAAMCRAATRLFNRWEFSSSAVAHALGDPSVAFMAAWHRGRCMWMSTAIATRISLLLEIYGLIRRLLPGSRRECDWLRAENSALGGKTAMSQMLGNNSSLIALRNYLRAALLG